jgi:hypothetical protein
VSPLLLAAVALADEPSPADVYPGLVEKELQIEKEKLASIPSMALLPSVPRTAMPTFADTSNSSWSDLLSVGVAVSDDDDLEAGLDISPLALAGTDGNAGNLRLSVGALAEGTRLGLAWPLDLVQPNVGAAVDEPKWTPRVESAQRQALLGLTKDWTDACEGFLGADRVAMASPGGLDAAWTEVRDGCRGQAQVGVVGIVATMERVLTDEKKEHAGKSDPAWDAFVAKVKTHVTALGNYDPAYVRSKDKMEEAYQQLAWKGLRLRLTPAFSADLAPVVWGYNPDPDTPLDKGGLARWSGGLSLGLAERRTTFDVGGSYAVEGSGDDAVSSVTPSVSVSWLAGALDNDAIVDKDGDIRLAEKQDASNTDAELPPRWYVGVTAKVKVLTAPDDTHLTPIDSFELTPYADFHVTDKLAFRLGVPIKGESATRDADTEADPPVTEETGLQVSVPVMLMTVLEL